MKEYLTIGEFAKLHNVNQKSLRYYEQIGVLIPAWTDPSTGYRYYALEQLIEMDMILMCLELDIPLKEAQQYRNADQTLDIRHLLRDGQQKAQEKMHRLQDILAQALKEYRNQTVKAPAFTFPIGLIAEKKGGKIETGIFLEVLRQTEEIPRLDTLPQGTYLCRQKPAGELADTERLIGDYFSQRPEVRCLIITNLTSAHFDPKGLKLELQEPL